MNRRAQEIYASLVEEFDSKDEFYQLLESYFEKHGNIPKRYIADWNAYQRDKRPWRQQPGTDNKLKKAARMMAKNERLSEGKKKEKASKYLDKQMRKMGADDA
jgi:hypothetical protein